MRLVTVFLLLFVSLPASATIIWKYDLSGRVDGPESTLNYLENISSGDQFKIRMAVLPSRNGSHGVRFSGNIGSWVFEEQYTEGFYYFGGSAPEIFVTSGSSSYLYPPKGRIGEIEALDIYIQIFGCSFCNNDLISEEDRLIMPNGWVNPKKFRSGGMAFNFVAILDPETREGIETDLFGTIDSFVLVPEPRSIGFSIFIGLLGIVASLFRRQCRN